MSLEDTGPRESGVFCSLSDIVKLGQFREATLRLEAQLTAALECRPAWSRTSPRADLMSDRWRR